MFKNKKIVLYKITNIVKAVSSKKREWFSFDMAIFFIKGKISHYYSIISLGDYEDKKKSFIRLHYLKMLKHYVYLKIYHYNIKKLSSNEKLLYYFE